MTRAVLMTTVALSLLTAPSPARAAVWTIDSAHSTAAFSIRHMMISNVRGQFGHLEGTVEIEGDDPATARVDVSIDPASIDTGEPRRDAHLRSADFFDVAAHPTMGYASRRIEKVGDRYRVVGDLTMHGVTREVVLDVDEVTPPIRDQRGVLRRGVSASGTLDRKDFGLTWNRLLETGGVVVGDEVRLTIDLELIGPEAAPPTS